MNAALITAISSPSSVVNNMLPGECLSSTKINKSDKEKNAVVSISVCFASNAIDEDNKVTTSKRSETSNDFDDY